MKKSLLILGMITCLLGMTGCGKAEEVIKNQVINQELADSVASGLVSEIDTYALNGVTTLEDFYQVGASLGFEDEETEVYGKALENYCVALEDLGSYQEVKDVTFTETNKEIEIKCIIVGSEIDPKGANRTANGTIVFVKEKGTVKFDSMLVNVNYTFGELMKNAGLNTILGLFTVFFVLVILMVIISCFKIIYNIQNKAATKKTAVETTVDNTVAQIVENEEVQDDTELIAVIAAAIAASEGAASTDGYVVRSVRRRY